MGIKSTQRITRQRAIDILMEEIPLLPNDALGDIMDALADTEKSKYASKFDNFTVSEFASDEES
jgi:hypothetical protein